jgi:micrococcal nuclease
MYEYKIKEIVHFVDGDTFDCIIDLGFDVFHKIRVRMYGINTPESRTRDLDEKKKGLAAKGRLKEILTEGIHPNYDLILKTKEKGKFGRWLGIIIRRFEDDVDQDVNQMMIEEGHAVPYFGGKR